MHYDKMLFPFFAINTNCSCNFCTIMSYFYQKHLGKQSDKSFCFLIHSKHDFYRKICWNTSQYDFIAILKNNFPFDTDIKNLGPYLFILKSEIWTLSFFASNQKKILSLKSMYCQSIFFFTKKIIFRLINPDWEIKREKFNVL